jgi:pimeloyl-ACP methyl ester carboxylesterase
VFIHGAQHDHSVWTLQSRWFAHHGFGVLAVDLPGHGRSEGPALPDVRPGRLAAGPARCRRRAAGGAGRPQHGLADRAGSRDPRTGLRAEGARAPCCDSGHHLMAEQPDEMLAAVRQALE